MSNGPPPPLPLTAQERADLVAYLDGELEGEAAQSMEAKISLDPRMRAEAESLKKAWDLLDFLPKPPDATSEFTEKTMSRLDAYHREDPVPPWARWLVGGSVWGLAVLLFAVIGYVGFSWAYPPEPGEKELERDLRVIENKQHYDRVDNFNFLEALNDPDLFGDVTSP
jgi:hypothetical protein